MHSRHVVTPTLTPARPAFLPPQRCGRDSTSSANVQDYYDLMPQVRGFPSLSDSLVSAGLDGSTGRNKGATSSNGSLEGCY